MRKKLMVRVCWLVALVVLISMTAGCGQNVNVQGGAPENTGTDTPGLKVVTTTTLMAHIVEEVGKDRVEVLNIIPPASCPGHFDVKPADMMVLADAKLFFVHNWQGELFTDDLIRSARNDQLEKAVLAVQGNWLVPDVQQEAITKIAAELAKADPDHTAFYEQNAAALKETVTVTGQEMKERLSAAGVDEIKVLVSEMQTGFIKWAGFEVVGSFGRPEDTSPKDMEQLMALGRESGVTLVVDNLQSGHEAGKSIAHEMGARHVVLSNFPGGFDGTETWALTIQRNVDLLLNTIQS
ncbi:MAG: metal ABC transporter substrate-binding protein [Clostridia bacterium]|nr:metal ABC transporter substrate-binding protein [Clostridia bacterium]